MISQKKELFIELLTQDFRIFYTVHFQINLFTFKANLEQGKNESNFKFEFSAFSKLLIVFNE